MKSTLLWLSLTICTGVLAKLSIPPLNMGFASVLAWACALVVALRFGKWRSLLCGFVLGSFWFSDLPISLASWGWKLPIFSWLLGAMACSTILGLTALLASRSSSIIRPLVFPCIFCCFVYLGQHLLHAPIAISPLLITSWPDLFTISHYVGFYGIEFIITLLSSIVATVFARRKNEYTFSLIILEALRNTALIIFSRNKKALIASSLTALILLSPSAYQKNNVSQTSDIVNIYGIQPAISYRDAKRAGNSLFYRQQNRDTLDRLTALAIKEDQPGIIIWPEGGHNFPNLSINQRRKNIVESLLHSNKELLIAGYEINSIGSKFNTITHVNQQGIGTTVAKTKLAPLAENYLTKGQEANVIKTALANLGIVICFEAMFNQHYRTLVDKGAEIFIVSTDDSSFGDTGLYWRHLAYARVNAAVFRTPLVFINNNGPSFLIDRYGSIIEQDNRGKQAHVITWSMDIAKAQNTDNSASHDIIKFVILFLLLGFTLTFIVKGKENAASSSQNINTIHQKLLCCVLLFMLTPLSLAADFALLSFKRGMNIDTLWSETQLRIQGEQALDAIAPLYKQKQQASCGAAALAFALTRMGDHVFELHITQQYEPRNPRGFSLSELKHIAQTSGFKAEGLRISEHELPTSKQPPVIAHWHKDHYVVVVHNTANEVIYFDPALGKIVNTERAVFLSQWQGVVLKLNYDDWLDTSNTQI